MSPIVKKKAKLRQVLRLLEKMYGKLSERRPRNGLDVLVEAMLAQNTNMANATRGYRMLRRQFPTWGRVMDAPVGDVQRQIAICGLARMRARRLQDMLRRIRQAHGRLSLAHLARAPTSEAFAYLMGYHGIGPKTAAFTLLFGFGHPLLPVDNGVLRVIRRLRLVRAKARDLEAERVLSPLIATGNHLPTHLLLFRHAKARCRPRNPKCDECALLKLCPHGQRVIRHRPPDKEQEVDELRRRARVLARYVSAGIPKGRDEERRRGRQ